MLNGSDEVTASAESVIHNQRHALRVTRIRDGPDIRNIILRVPDTLNIHRLRLVINRRRNILRLIPLHKLRLDTETRQHNLQLVVGTAVEEGGRDDVVAGVGERGDGHELRGLAGGGGDGCDTTLQRGDTLLEHIIGRLGRKRQIGEFEGRR